MRRAALFLVAAALGATAATTAQADGALFGARVG